MELVDQHLHSYFSPDSMTPLETYCQLTTGGVVTTEHLDFGDPFSGGTDVIPNDRAYRQEIARLEEIYGDRLLTGIEVGYSPATAAQIHRFLADHDYDVILLSVHHNDVYDFMQPIVTGMPKDELVRMYLGQMLAAVQEIHEAQVLAHFDYGFRLIGLTVSELAAEEALLCELLQAIKVRGMALEINTRSMYQYNNLDLYEYVIGLNKAIGGTHYSLGSDAHRPDYYRYHFDDAIVMLKGHGISELVQIRGGKMDFVAI